MLFANQRGCPTLFARPRLRAGERVGFSTHFDELALHGDAQIES